MFKGEEKKICLCNGIGGYKLDGCNNKKLHLKRNKHFETQKVSTRITYPIITENPANIMYYTTDRTNLIEMNEMQNISVANMISSTICLKMYLVVAILCKSLIL